MNRDPTDHVGHRVLAVDGLELLNLLPDEGHDADPAEDVLTAEAFARHPVGESLGVVVAGLAEVPHEEADVRSEALL